MTIEHSAPPIGIEAGGGSVVAGPSARASTPAAPEGRRLLRIEARNAATPIERKPPWIKVKAKMGPEYTQLRGLVSREGLHTVCRAAGRRRS